VRGGVCPAKVNDRLWLFYPYFDVGKPLVATTRPHTMVHAQVPDTQVDVSDHYPLLVDLKLT
jgi:hypothetical protein